MQRADARSRRRGAVTGIGSVRKLNARTMDELETDRAELEAAGELRASAIALPADEMLWACSLTGLCPVDLAPKEGNEGA